MHRVCFGLILFTLVCGAVDLNGTWQVNPPAGRNGLRRVTTYVFKVDGDHFTGKYGTLTETRDVINGKMVDPTHITFDTHFEFYAPERVDHFKGEITDDGLIVTSANAPAGGRGGRGGAPTPYKKISDATVYVPPAEATPHHKPLGPIKPVPPNGLALTPPMGWNSWNKFAGRIDDKTVREIADAMVSSGMKDAGYVYVNIDDTWEGKRDEKGVLQPNEKFPDMKALADYVHSKGLKLGIYSGPGNYTCQMFPASYGYEELDAKTWADWGIDYVKYDWCSASAVYHRDEMQGAYQKMALALRATGRPMIFSICEYGWLNVGEWGAAAGGNLWRTTGDIRDTWESMSTIGFDNQIGRERYAGPGHWNDTDMLEIGNGGMTTDEYRTHLSLWSILAAPLIAGHDVRVMTPEAKAILTNREVLAIDQDKKGVQGTRVRKDGDLEVWQKPLADGVAVGLFNRGAAAAKITVKWSEVGITKKSPAVRDLWAHQDVTSPGECTAEVPSHGVVMLRVK